MRYFKIITALFIFLSKIFQLATKASVSKVIIFFRSDLLKQKLANVTKYSL